MGPDPALRKALLAKGSAVAAQLSALLDHKEVDLSSLPPKLKPDEDPELRLRAFLGRIDRALKAFGTDRYGRCAQCGAPLAPAVLAEQPWLDGCALHPVR